MKIGFIGAGQMATALAVGISTNFPSFELLALDPSDAAFDAFASSVAGDVARCANNIELVHESELVFLAVKPQVAEAALERIEAGDASFVSVIAGIRIERLAVLLSSNRLVRAMPNTPCLIGKGITALCKSATFPEQTFEQVHRIFEAVGKTIEVPERLMDAVTGLSGSGPAFVYTFIESLTDAGVVVGLPRDAAQTLALQTVVGSAEMMLHSGDHPAVLRDRVTSPGGTTIHGMEKLEKMGFRSGVIAAVRAAAERSIELG